jgi:hypothetical protein
MAIVYTVGKKFGAEEKRDTAAKTKFSATGNRTTILQSFKLQVSYYND